MGKEKVVKFGIKLQNPIKRSDVEITEVSLRKPSAGELRGHNLTSLAEGDVNAMLKLIPRISMPALLETEVASMDPADFSELAGEIISFLVPASQLAELRGKLNT